MRDVHAVRNAITEPWSSGQAEGQINRLKTLKRAVYGRAGIELVRARMLPLEPNQREKESGKNFGVLCGSEQRRDWLKDRVEGQRRQVGLVPEPLS
jgi:hypothetical protein